MAKRKKNSKKKSKKTASKLDLAVITIMMFSILLGVLIYTKSGVVGVKLNDILGGIFGIMQYVLPVGGIAISIKLASEGSETLNSKMLQYFVCIISISIALSVMQISAGELQSGKELSEVVKDAYALGEQSKGGGAIGAVAAVPLAKLLGDIGAVIFCLGIAVILFVFTFGINISEIINNFVEKTEENREEKYERRQQLREEQKKARMEAKQESIENRKKAKELQKEQARREALEEEDVGEQIKINFGGRILEEDDKKGDDIDDENSATFYFCQGAFQ